MILFSEQTACDSKAPRGQSSLHKGLVTHQARAYRFLLHEVSTCRSISTPPLDGMLHEVVHCRATSIKFAETHLYTWVRRDTLNKVICPIPDCFTSMTQRQAHYMYM